MTQQPASTTAGGDRPATADRDGSPASSDPAEQAPLGWFRKLLVALMTKYAPPGVGRATFCSPIVGVGAGLGAVAFLVSLQLLSRLVIAGAMGMSVPPTAEEAPRAVHSYDPSRWWLVVLCPAVGGLISGLIVFRWAPEAEGHGTDALIRAFHRGAGVIRSRVPLVKSIASVITIGTGGSAGQEGPIAQIGAGLGSIIARRLRLTPHERRLLMLAGAAGGVGAIFRAPLGGALFATEVIYMHDGDRVGGPAALPDRLDHRLLDLRAVHHARADLHPAEARVPRARRAAAVRRAGDPLRRGRDALRPGLLRRPRPRLPQDPAPPARQAGDRRPGASA